MIFDSIYDLGKSFPLISRIASWDEKLELIQFDYNSSQIASGALIVAMVSILVALLTFQIPLLSYSVGFLGIAIAIGSVMWAISISYAQGVVSIREEMLQALLEISNHISLNTSIDAALVYSAENIRGILGKQLRSIKDQVETKQVTTLGEALEEYIPIWLKINPDFVKGLNLLQTAANAPREERDVIINEVIETIILSYYDQGKRLTEKLSNQTKSLISMGLILPMMSLILLPLVTIFLPNLTNPSALLFIYVVLFPTILLFLAMNFATNRVQVNTIDMGSSPFFKETPVWYYIFPVAIALILMIFPIVHVMTMNLNDAVGVQREYALGSIFVMWLGLFGLFLAIELFCYFYSKRNEQLWLEMEETERDLPNLLQIFSSYLSLNRSMESIFSDLISDYKQHGFGNHPTVKIITGMKEALYNTKKPLIEITDKILPKLAPSKRMAQILKRITLFADIDSKSAAKSAKMIRSQTISIYNLDDYIQTLLSETVSIVSLSTVMLAPLLATAATIMAAAIVMALEFIKQRINSIMTSIGGQAIDLQFVDVNKIIPPTMLELIVGLFFIETAIILSIFLSNIKYGTDKYKLAKTIFENLLIAFIIYSVLMFGGYLAFTEFIFKGVLTG
jgi:hypothetical protein